MDMNMDQSSAAPTSAAPMSSMTATHSTSMPAMTMAMTFSADTRVTLLFNSWTTTSPGAYVLAIFLLFAASVLHRSLGSLRAQLERSWLEQQLGDDEGNGVITSAAASQRDRRLSRMAKYIIEEGVQEAEPLSPRAPGEVGPYNRGPRRAARFWTPSGPWHWRRDGTRALLEFVRAAIGYLLMLAVMTFNIGVFFAVLSGILIGELAFGRYSQGGSARLEDGCHD